MRPTPGTEPKGGRAPLREALSVYARPRLLAILFMGFASGLPLALTGATLAIRLADAHVSLASIGFSSLAAVAYNVKFAWAPLLDRVPVPVLTRLLGRRRSWALVIQACLAGSILGLGFADPARDLVATAAWAVAVAFFSASQDVVIDAFRVELLTEAEQGAGAAATQFGYRIGMLVSGAGALYAAAAWDWRTAYGIMAALLIIGVATVLLAPRPEVALPPSHGHWVRDTIVQPFADFAERRGWAVILMFVVLYNLGDAMAGHLAGPFYVQLGFSKPEIASVSKIFGVFASLAGVSLGGLVVYRLGIMPALFVCGIVKMSGNLMYIVQSAAGHDMLALTGTIGVENLTGGMASAAFVAYLSRLCSPAFTATQYALLSALATSARTVLSSGAGVLAAALGWPAFFALAASLGLPSLVLLVWLMRDPRGLKWT